jgi:hypothetical protein
MHPLAGPVFNMRLDEKPAVATLAAAIVIARTATTISAIREAWEDAEFIVSPAPATARYKLWQERHGEAPSGGQQSDD